MQISYRFARAMPLVLAALLGGCAAVATMGEARMAAELASAALPAPDAGPTAAPPAPPENPAAAAAVKDAPRATAGARIVIYSASLRLVVPNLSQTMAAIRRAAESLGGYLQDLDDQSITVRVPAAKFQDLVTACEKMGEVTQRVVKGLDITEEMRDLAIRLQTAEETRKRLLDHLAKSDKIKDTLEIEKELERVTQTIEQIKGRVQFLSSQAAYSTLKVTLNSPLPQRQMVAQLPFAWVRNLGDGLVSGVAQAQPDTSRWRSRAPRFELPKGYIRYYEREGVCEAMSSDGVMLKLQRQDNYDGGDLGFWGGLCRRSLVENRALAVSQEEEIALKNKAKARWLVGTKDIGGKPNGYLLAVVATDRYVYTFEAWGEQAAFERDLGAIREAAITLNVN